MRHADAARLLADARSLASLPPLLHALGFAVETRPLGRSALMTLRAASAISGAATIDGRGAERALLAEVATAHDLRETAVAALRTLTGISPGTRWLVALARADGGETMLALSTDARRGRVVALAFDPRRVLASDVETLCALAAAQSEGTRNREPTPSSGDRTSPTGGGTTRHARWGELLGREALSRRFYRALESVVARLAAGATGAADGATRRSLALLQTSRLLFLAFLQSKGWLDDDHDFLRRGYDACVATGGDYHRRVLRPLYFGTLNTPWSKRAAAARAFGRVPFLNGGLFAPTVLERRHRSFRLDDAALGALIALLGRYRFTSREEESTYSEAAVDPEMLGRAFESLMSAHDRRTTGAFYTPHALVAHTTDEALRIALGSCPETEALLGGAALVGDRAAALRARLAGLRILDPACGSGAFLVHALERISELLRRCGDERPLATIRRDVLTHGIFGVDVNPTAVWLCELRLWLSVVVESDEGDPMRVAPLPNLDHNARVGDSLAAPAATRRWGGDPWCEGEPSATASATPTTERLRARYVRASGRRKVALGTALESAERAVAVAALDRMLAVRRAERRDVLTAARGRDLFGARRGALPGERARLVELRALCRALAARRRALLQGAALPFGFAWHFPELAARGGADVVLANPPWVRPHTMPAAERRLLRATYESCRDATWVPGASAAHAGRGFGGQVDLAAPFVERSLALVRPGGVAALIVPAKLWRALAGGGLRQVLRREAMLHALEDWSDAPALFDAAVYPSVLVAERRCAGAAPRGAGRAVCRADARSRITVHRATGATGATGAIRWTTAAGTLPLDGSPGAPWLLVPPDVRRALASLADAGTPLGSSGAVRITLGVKCGCNAAFLVRGLAERGDVAMVDGVWPDGTPRHGAIERAMLRPVVRGETLHSTPGDAAAREYILWTCDALGDALPTLPPLAARWLAPWRARLAARSDATQSRARWWGVFRTAAAEVTSPRVVWADVARALLPRLLDAGDPTVPLNSCYALRCATDRDARRLTALLASPLADAWCSALAEPARGGYRRHLAWTLALFPVPRRLDALGDEPLTADSLAAAYALPIRAMTPLLRTSLLPRPPVTPDEERFPSRP